MFLLLALVAVQCARLGAAGLFVQLGQGEIDRWTTPPRAPRVAEVRLAEKYFRDSLDYAPGNPWVYEGMGALDLTRMRASRVPREALAYARGAYVRFRAALRLRPTSPFLWSNLALTKLYLDEIDDELRTALRHADALGPWERPVQETVVFVGLAVWPDLGTEGRETVVRSIERGAGQNAQKMFEIVKSYRRLELICAIDKYRKIAASDCALPLPSGGAGGSKK